MGSGTAWGGHLACTEKIRRVRFPHSPPLSERIIMAFEDVNFDKVLTEMHIIENKLDSLQTSLTLLNQTMNIMLTEIVKISAYNELLVEAENRKFEKS